MEGGGRSRRYFENCRIGILGIYNWLTGFVEIDATLADEDNTGTLDDKDNFDDVADADNTIFLLFRHKVVFVT